MRAHTVAMMVLVLVTPVVRVAAGGPLVVMSNARQLVASHTPAWASVDVSMQWMGTVYCKPAPEGTVFTSADLHSTGTNFTLMHSGVVSFTGLQPVGDERVVVACAGEDQAGNLGDPAVSSPIAIDVTGPGLTDVAASLSGSTVTATGTADEAGTVYCIVYFTGGTRSADDVKSQNRKEDLAAAGTFRIDIATPSSDQSGMSVFCVAEDGWGNTGSVVTGEFGRPPTGVSLTAGTIAENSPQATTIGTLHTADPDAGDTFSYTIVSQSAADALQISGDKLQVGSGVLDFETTSTIAVTVRSTDSASMTFDKDLTITLTNVNEGPTGMGLSASTVVENSAQGTSVGTLSTTDPDAGDTFAYTITSQSTADAFQISGDKLQVGQGVLNFETSGTIDVTLRSTDAGGLTFDKTFTIALTNVNEAPTGTGLSATTIAENSPQATDVGTLTTSDPDAGDSFTYAITSQSVADAFQISGDKLQVGSGVLNFERTTTIDVMVQSTDAGGLMLDTNFTITLTNVNETPTDLSLSGTSIADDSTAQGSVVGTLSTTDPDASDTFTYAISSQSVADAFQIQGGELQAGPSGASLATDAVVSVSVATTDAGGLTFTRAFDITVTETTNVTALAIIAAALTVVAGFTYAFYAHGKRVASAAVAKPATSV